MTATWCRAVGMSGRSQLAAAIVERAALALEQQGWTPSQHVDLATGAISYTQALTFAAGGDVGAGHDYADEPADAGVREVLHDVEVRLLARAGVPATATMAACRLAAWEAAPGRTAAEVFELAGVHLSAARHQSPTSCEGAR